MIGTKLYAKKSRVYFFLLMYGILALAGGALVAQSIAAGEKLSNAAGFMVIFGAGMFIMTLVKGRRPQVAVSADFLTLNQTRMQQLVRYRNIVTVSRPDKNRLIVTLREDGVRKDVTIWLRELDKADGDKLADFLSQMRRRA
jgi:hypothetical protein